MRRANPKVTRISIIKIACLIQFLIYINPLRSTLRAIICIGSNGFFTYRYILLKFSFFNTLSRMFSFSRTKAFSVLNTRHTRLATEFSSVSFRDFGRIRVDVPLDQLFVNDLRRFFLDTYVCSARRRPSWTRLIFE